jgi:hypothetical protein
VLGELDFDALADDSVLSLEAHPHELRAVLAHSGLHPSMGGTGSPAPFAPTLDEAPWLSSPGVGGCKSKSDEEILMADLDAEALRLEELVLLCDEEASDVVKTIGGVRRHVTQEAPRRVVRFPWGDVPSPWVEKNKSTAPQPRTRLCVFYISLARHVVKSLYYCCEVLILFVVKSLYYFFYLVLHLLYTFYI